MRIKPNSAVRRLLWAILFLSGAAIGILIGIIA